MLDLPFQLSCGVWWLPCGDQYVLKDLVKSADQHQANWYGTASKQIIRLIRVTPGRISAIYAEAAAGATVIRVFGVQSVYLRGG